MVLPLLCSNTCLAVSCIIIITSMIIAISTTCDKSWLLNAHYNAFLGAVHVCKLKLPIVSRVVGDVFLCAALPPRRSTNQKREQVWADQSWCSLAVEDDCFFSLESLKENHGYVHWGPPLHYTSQSVKLLSGVHLSVSEENPSHPPAHPLLVIHGVEHVNELVEVVG